MNDHEARSNAAARALDALEPHEAEAVDAAADRLEELGGEVQAFRETAAQLGLAARPVTPPAALRARLLAEIATTPQLPAGGEGGPGAVARTGTVASTDSVASTEALASTDAGRPGKAEERARARWYARPGILTGAAAAALALFAGGVAVGTVLDGDSAGMRAEADALAELYAAPDARRSTADVRGGETATLVWSEHLDRSAVIFDRLEALPSDSVYQAWYIDSAGNASSAGTFPADSGGPVFHALDGSLLRGGTVGVTVEPEPGSDAPTTKPIVVLNRS